MSTPEAGETGAGGSGVGGSGEDDARSFEELLSELESVTEQLAAGQIGIEVAADLYERAEHLHAVARARLEAVQARVDRLDGGVGGHPGHPAAPT